LTDEEWEKLRRLREHKRLHESDRPNKKRKHEEIENSDEENSDVDPSAIEGYRKKQKMSKEERTELLRVSSGSVWALIR
jgi:DNA-binding transcriptional regulator YiaG